MLGNSELNGLMAIVETDDTNKWEAELGTPDNTLVLNAVAGVADIARIILWGESMEAQANRNNPDRVPIPDLTPTEEVTLLEELVTDGTMTSQQAAEAWLHGHLISHK